MNYRTLAASGAALVAAGGLAACQQTIEDKAPAADAAPAAEASVTVPQAPDVNVNPPDVNINPPDVNVNPPSPGETNSSTSTTVTVPGVGSSTTTTTEKK